MKWPKCANIKIKKLSLLFTETDVWNKWSEQKKGLNKRGKELIKYYESKRKMKEDREMI